MGGAFAARLAASFGNFGDLKLEEPLIGPEGTAIREATGDRIGVLVLLCYKRTF